VTKTGKLSIVAAFIAAVAAGPATVHADPDNVATRCDCSRTIGTCNADIWYENRFQAVMVQLDTKACARVTYYINGARRVDTVTGGFAAETLLNPQGFPDLEVTSCELCLDKTVSRNGKR